VSERERKTNPFGVRHISALLSLLLMTCIKREGEWEGYIYKEGDMYREMERVRGRRRERESERDRDIDRERKRQ